MPICASQCFATRNVLLDRHVRWPLCFIVQWCTAHECERTLVRNAHDFVSTNAACQSTRLNALPQKARWFALTYALDSWYAVTNRATKTSDSISACRLLGLDSPVIQTCACAPDHRAAASALVNRYVRWPLCVRVQWCSWHECERTLVCNAHDLVRTDATCLLVRLNALQPEMRS